VLITLHAGRRDEGPADSAFRLVWPAKKVRRAGPECYGELGIGQNFVAQPVFAGVFALRPHIGMADVNGAEFIHADAAVEDLRLARPVSKNQCPSCCTSEWETASHPRPIPA